MKFDTIDYCLASFAGFIAGSSWSLYKFCIDAPQWLTVCF